MTKARYPSPAVAQAIRILDYLGHVRAEAGVSEVSRALGISKTNCFHILSTLAAFGVVNKDRRATYRLGPKLVELGTASRRNFSFREIVRRTIRPIVEASGVCCLVGQVVEADIGIVVVDRVVPTTGEDPLTAPVGELYPLTAPAMGRAVLAERPIEEAMEIWRSLSAGDPRRDSEARKSLELVRRRGFSTSVKEYQAGVNAVAATVKRDNGEIIAVLCLIGHEDALPTDRLEYWGGQLVEVSHRLTGLIDNPTLPHPHSMAE